MIKRLWRRYMADIDEYEQAARETDDRLMLALLQQAKGERIFALCMAVVMLVFATATIWKIIGKHLQ
jgi:cell division protein FtsL